MPAAGENYIRAALDHACEAVARTASGRNAALNREAFGLGQLVGGGHLDRDHAEKRLFDAAERSGYVAKDGPGAAWATIRSGLDHGALEPRAVPEGARMPPEGQSVPRARQRPQTDTLPDWTPPDATGKPTLQFVGRDEPPAFQGEVRRHVYRRNGAAVRVKILRANGQWSNMYRVRRPGDGTEGWQAKKPAAFVSVPYVGPARILDLGPPEALVFWTEGEKDADTLRAAGQLALTWGGAGDVPAEAGDYLAGRHVVILADNDRAGRDCAARKLALLQARAASAVVVDFTELPENGDVSDYLAGGGTIDGLMARVQAARSAPAEAYDDAGRFPPPEGEPVSSTTQRTRFPVLHLDELEIGDDPVWLIDGLLPVSGFGVVYGPPKSGKSFLLADALFHVAMGRSWAGRAVMQGAIVYITGEGVEGFKRRLIAMRRHYAVEGQGVPFVMVPVAPDLGHASGDDAALIEDVRAYLAMIGNPPVRAIAIDTLARTMRGADESTAKDMTTFVDNCDRIGAAFGCIVVAVHHAGKDVSKGARGSNSLDGAVDVMWSVEKGEACSTAEIVHMKDAEAQASWQFRLLPIALRNSSATVQGVTAAVVEIVTQPGEAQQAATARNISLPDRPRHLLDVLTYALEEMGEFVKGDPNVPHDKRSISRDHLRKYLPIKGYWESSTSTNAERTYLSRDISTLVARHIAGAASGRLWLLR